MARKKSKLSVPFADAKLDDLLAASQARGDRKSRERTAFYKDLADRSEWAASTIESAVRDNEMTADMEAAILASFELPERERTHGWRYSEDGSSTVDGREEFRRSVAVRYGQALVGDAPFAYVLQPSQAKAELDSAFAIADLGFQQDGRCTAEASFGTMESEDYDFAIRCCYLTITFPPTVSVRPRSWLGASGHVEIDDVRVVARSVSSELNWELSPAKTDQTAYLDGYLLLEEPPLFTFQSGSEGAVVELVLRATPKGATRAKGGADASNPSFDIAREHLIERIQQLARFGDSDKYVLSRHARVMEARGVAASAEDQAGEVDR